MAFQFLFATFCDTVSFILVQHIFTAETPVVEIGLSSIIIMSLCLTIYLMLGLGAHSAFCFNNSLINFDLLSFFKSALFIYIDIFVFFIKFHYTIPIDKS